MSVVSSNNSPQWAGVKRNYLLSHDFHHKEHRKTKISSLWCWWNRILFTSQILYWMNVENEGTGNQDEWGRLMSFTLPWKENHKLTRNGCSNDDNSSTSFSTPPRAPRPQQALRLTYFIANSRPESRFCTMQTCSRGAEKRRKQKLRQWVMWH